MGEPVNPDNVYSQNLCKGLVSLHQQPLVLDIVSARRSGKDEAK
ncbi:MAG: hypothetical protein NT128_04460 [Proteobacteria bacterium]|nr:hypothetical protein [Pseudomonadota bacterium]